MLVLWFMKLEIFFLLQATVWPEQLCTTGIGLLVFLEQQRRHLLWETRGVVCHFQRLPIVFRSTINRTHQRLLGTMPINHVDPTNS